MSISIDTQKDHEKWNRLVTEKQLGGNQLFADNDWNSQFVKEYAIKWYSEINSYRPKWQMLQDHQNQNALIYSIT